MNPFQFEHNGLSMLQVDCSSERYPDQPYEPHFDFPSGVRARVAELMASLDSCLGFADSQQSNGLTQEGYLAGYTVFSINVGPVGLLLLGGNQTTNVPVSNEYDQLPSEEVSTRVSMRFSSPLKQNMSLFALLVTRGAVRMHSGLLTPRVAQIHTFQIGTSVWILSPLSPRDDQRCTFGSTARVRPDHGALFSWRLRASRCDCIADS